MTWMWTVTQPGELDGAIKGVPESPILGLVMMIKGYGDKTWSSRRLNALRGRCLKSARASPRSTSLADTYATMEIIKYADVLRDLASSKLGLMIARRGVTMTPRMRVKGTAAIGIIVTAREETCQSFCSV